MKTLMALLTVLMFSISAQAGECLKSDAPPQITVRVAEADGKYEMAGKVLCCCSTYSGTQCCNYVLSCFGFIPGCFCNKLDDDKDDIAALPKD